MECSLPSSSVHGISTGKNTGVCCRFLLQGVFLTQGSNPGLLHCRWILYQLSHQGSLYHQQAPSQTSHIQGNVRIVQETENRNGCTASLQLRETVNTFLILIYNSLINIWYYSFNICVANVGLQNFYPMLGVCIC